MTSLEIGDDLYDDEDDEDPSHGGSPREVDDETQFLPPKDPAPLALSGTNVHERPARLVLSHTTDNGPLNVRDHSDAAYLKDTETGFPIFVTPRGVFFTVCLGVLIEGKTPAAIERLTKQRQIDVEAAVPALSPERPWGRHQKEVEVRAGISKVFIAKRGTKRDRNTWATIHEDSVRTAYVFDHEVWEQLGVLQAEWDAWQAEVKGQEEEQKGRRRTLVATLTPYTPEYHDTATRTPMSEAKEEGKRLLAAQDEQYAEERAGSQKILTYLLAQKEPVSAKRIAKETGLPEGRVYEVLAGIRHGSYAPTDKGNVWGRWYALGVYSPRWGHSGEPTRYEVREFSQHMDHRDL